MPIPPPAKVPQVLFKGKASFKIWADVHKDFPRTEKFGLGRRIDEIFLLLLEQIFITSYLPLQEKITALGKISHTLDKLKFFMQLAWEHKRIPTEKYTLISKELEEIGRQIGGWKKGLLTKTLP